MNILHPYQSWNRGKLQWRFIAYLLFGLIVSFSSCQQYEPHIPEFDYAEIPADRMSAYAQVDTNLHRFSTITDTDAHLDSLFYCINLLLNNNKGAALEYAKEASRIATEKGKTRGRALSYYYMALLKGRQKLKGENVEGALVDAKIAKRLFEEVDDKPWRIEATRLLGSIYFRMREGGLAQQTLLESLELAKKYDIPQEEAKTSIGEIYHTLASVYFAADSTYDKALDYSNKSLALYELNDNQLALSRLRTQLGRHHMRQSKYGTADSLYQLSLKYGIENKDQYVTSTAYNRLGYLNYRQFRKNKDLTFYEQALVYYRKGLMVTEDNSYFFYNRIANTYQMRAATKHYQASNLDSAIINYSRALRFAQIEGAFELMPRIVRNISDLCNNRLQMVGESCTVLLGQPYTTLLNEGYAAVNSSVIEDLEQANQKSSAFERKILEAENKRRILNQRWLAVGVLLFASLIFLILLQSFRQKRLKAQMEALRAQINPHFISNSLNAIESLVNLDQKEAASKYIIHFARLSRQILNGSREANTTLKEELKMLEHFLALEQLRFRDKLTYEILVEKNVESEVIELPAMILQPYVENAIWHGIKPKVGAGLLQIKVQRTDKQLHCIIEDNGVGRAKAAELKAASVLQQKSIGMQINHERLQASGKVKGSRINIEDLFDAEGRPAGTRVFLRLPLKYKKN